MHFQKIIISFRNLKRQVENQLIQFQNEHVLNNDLPCILYNPEVILMNTLN